MTSPPPADQRAALQTVTAAASAEITSGWSDLDLNDAVAVKQWLLELLPAVADQYGSAASELALDVYGMLRDEAKALGRYDEQVAQVTDKLDEWARFATDPLFAAEPDFETALYRAEGVAQKAVADQYRETIQDTALADPAALGWQRVARADGCPFCVLLASRGAVYTEKTADFGAHLKDHCVATPAFGGAAVPVKPFEPSSRNITAADRARVYRYMRAHGLLDGETRRPKTSRR